MKEMTKVKSLNLTELEEDYVSTYSSLVGISEGILAEYVETYGFKALLNPRAPYLRTKTQRTKHEAVQELLRLKNEVNTNYERVSSPKTVIYYIRKAMENIDTQENFVAIYLDCRRNIKAVERLSLGTDTESTVSAKLIFRNAIINNYYAVIIAHNHPSGDVSPSPGDEAGTQKLVEAGKVLGIPIIDHIIINSDSDYYSFAEEGQINY